MHPSRPHGATRGIRPGQHEPSPPTAPLPRSGLVQALVNLDGIITEISDDAPLFTAEPARDLVGRPLLSQVPHAQRTHATAGLDAVLRGEQPVLFIEGQAPDGDGSRRDLLMWVAAIRATTGEVTELTVSIQDVTEHREALRQADRERAWWQSLSQNASDVAFILDGSLIAQYASPSLTKLLGYETGAVVGSPFLDLVYPADRDRVATSLLRPVGDRTQQPTLQFRLRDASGAWRTVEQRPSNLGEGADLASVILHLSDVTARRELERKLRQAVLRDRLTGLPNRALTMDRLHQALERPTVEGRRCALLLVDIDHFTAVNDAYGYASGDRVLTWAADILTSAVRPGDTVGRFGAGQFAVLLDQPDDPSGFDALARQLTSALNGSVELPGGVSLRVSACVGLVHSLSYGAEAMVCAAESALARAKARGRGQFVAYDSTFAGSLHGRSLGAELAAAVTAEQLTVHYQPIVELMTGRISGFEALVRWPHPELGLVSPGVFLPIAEALDLHFAIDQWVLEQACSAAHQWALSTGNRHTTIAVNVRPDRLLSSTFTQEVRAALRGSRLRPSALVLEVTENAVVTDLDLASRVLNELRRSGVTLSIDDFGTGHSSMLQLRQLPFGKLKLDREFVSGLPTSTVDLAICGSVLNLAKRLKVRSIAEGVETLEQASTLLGLGCEYGQGFLWSPAVDAETALALLRKDPWRSYADGRVGPRARSRAIGS